ncbi:unnamed protein product [Prorocentrum cordatum]|uniref:Uncharacterized protein n=1 Tax=Prorocentrum cordatum TaxID=2364126 RepID=A0ABN9TNS5_9DINO|nr:unnamed protein product [Polarella glacialis]
MSDVRRGSGRRGQRAQTARNWLHGYAFSTWNGLRGRCASPTGSSLKGTAWAGAGALAHLRRSPRPARARGPRSSSFFGGQSHGRSSRTWASSSSISCTWTSSSLSKLNGRRDSKRCIRQSGRCQGRSSSGGISGISRYTSRIHAF